MTDETNNQPSQPVRPPVRNANRYATFKRFRQEIAAITMPEQSAPENRQDLFSMTITAAGEKGEPMDEQKFLIDLIFKPVEPGLKLRPGEIQLIMSYIGEILKEIEIEEKLIEEEEKAKQERENTPCK